MSIRRLVRTILPRPILERGKQILSATAIRNAKMALAGAGDEHQWLPLSQLEELKSEYPIRYFWDKGRKASPDTERAKALAKYFGSKPKSLVEIGGGPGEVAWAMSRAGHSVTCVDLFDELDPSAASAGVKGVIGDAADTGLPSNSFDGLWSFNCFEHLHEPELALKESWRLVKNGGLIHLDFAPLYNAPLGLHAYAEIGVPFCQHLWRSSDILGVVSSKDLWNLNKLSIDNYRSIWNNCSDILIISHYNEIHDYKGIELIPKFPECFAKISRKLDDFTISRIVITFRVLK